METHTALATIVRPHDRVIAIVGNYGSGKTELAVNLALALARAGRRVQIADLDLVNPYFRCREARVLMEANGIRVVVPPGAQAWADLPIVLPEIRSMLHPREGVVTILDVGGDDAGARALASFRTSVAEGEDELWQVINAKRPFTDTVDGCLAMRRTIETASRWTITAVVVNSHLIDDTMTGDRAGWLAAGRRRSRAHWFADPARCRDGASRGSAGVLAIDAPLFELHRHMLPPWLQPDWSRRRRRRRAAGRSSRSNRPAGRIALSATGDLHGSH